MPHIPKSLRRNFINTITLPNRERKGFCAAVALWQPRDPTAAACLDRLRVMGKGKGNFYSYLQRYHRPQVLALRAVWQREQQGK